MMNNKRWAKYLITIIITILFLSITFNMYVDSYSILKKNYSSLDREPNQNFIKMNFLLNTKTKFDSLIFGSSRVGKINPKLLKNGNYYNMTYSEGLPREHLDNIKLLIKNKYKLKNIIIGLDDFSYEVSPNKHFNQLMRKPHYSCDSVPYTKLNFFLSYFLKTPTYFDFNTFFMRTIHINHKNTLTIDIYKTGMPSIPKEIDTYIENNQKKHEKAKKFLYPTHYSGNFIAETINQIQEIKKICQQNNINLTIFINPIHKTTYLDTNFKNFQQFKLELSNIINFYDFSGLNSITTNNYYFYETSHYRVLVGNMIIRKLSNQDTNFGTYVTNKNIIKHLDNLDKEIKKFRYNIFLKNIRL